MVLRSPAHRLTCQGDICSKTQWKKHQTWAGHPGSWGRAVQGAAGVKAPEKGASQEEQGHCGEGNEQHPPRGVGDEQEAGFIKCWMGLVGWVKNGQRVLTVG